MHPQLAKQYFERAEALLQKGNPDEALSLLNMLDEAFPNTKNIGLARAQALAALNRLPEAVRLCDALIEMNRSKRAKQFRELLIAKIHDAKPPPSAVPGSTRNYRPSAHFGLAVIAIVCTAGVSVWFFVRDNGAGEQVATTPEVSNARLGNFRPTIAISGHDAPVPGRVHSPFTWDLDENGVPRWESGIYRNVPCVGAPERTIDVYLPLAYDQRPDERFACVVISMPGGNPGFIELEAWAERQDVILIGLNSSRNGPSSNNIAAQDAAIATVVDTIRIDERLNFAIGMSGGAMAAWLVASRYPESFSGVVMMGQGGFEDRLLAPHIRVAYIRGDDEPNNWYIPRVIASLQTNGNEVRDQLVPGAHVMGPAEVRIEMLNWMLYAARRDLDQTDP